MEQIKKMVCIVKIESDTFLKYHVNNLLKFTDFLDEKHSNWRYFNVYDKETKQQVESFTKKKRPQYVKLLK